MAVKGFEMSFFISTEEILAFVAARNVGVKISALSDGKSLKQPRVPKEERKLLEGPKDDDDKEVKQRRAKGPMRRGKDENGNAVIAWQQMLQSFAKHPHHRRAVGELGAVLESIGLAPKSVSPQVSMMQNKGWLKRLEPGVYQLTAKGGVMAQQLGYKVADRKVEKKAKPPKAVAPKKVKPKKEKPKKPNEPEGPARATIEEPTPLSTEATGIEIKETV